MDSQVTHNFTKLYDQYVKRIYDFIYYKTFHKQTAEDLTSQTFMKAWKAFEGFDAAGGSFQAWIYKIARNTVIDYYRGQKQDVALEDVWGLADGNDLPTDVANRALLEQVQQELKKFSAEQREIVLLRVWSGLSYAEIADITGKSEGNCKVIFSRTIKQLKNSKTFAALLLLLLTNV